MAKITITIEDDPKNGPDAITTAYNFDPPVQKDVEKTVAQEVALDTVSFISSQFDNVKLEAEE